MANLDPNDVYREIKNDIIFLKHLPGVRLAENDLVKRYGMSRTPIRDILKHLEYDGLVTIQSKSGSYVTRIDMEGLSDIISIRSAAERMALTSLRGNVPERSIEALRKIIQEQRDLIESHDFDDERAKFASKLANLDDKFHLRLYALDHHRSIFEKLNDAYPTYYRFRVLSFVRHHDELQSFLANHEAMVDYLEGKGDGDVDRIVHDHNFTAFERVSSIVDEFPDYFTQK